MFTKLRSAHEVREAVRVAKCGLPELRREAAKAASAVDDAIAEGKPGYSILGSGSYARSAMYAVCFKARYPNASDEAIRLASYHLSWADSPLVISSSKRRGNRQEAKQAIIRMIDENKATKRA